MKQYKYTLDKTSKKFICPKCHKKTFVKYIQTDTGDYLSQDFGRCDRESKCKYHCPPNGEYNNPFEMVEIAKPKPSFHNYNLVALSNRNYEQNNFVLFLKTIFSELEVKQVIEKYRIGTSKHWKGATIFWQIDHLNKVRHGKILQYDSKRGKRFKNSNGKAFISSVRSVMRLNDFNLCQCLFGLHLINDISIKKIAIVESEKTAIIMSLFKPEYSWLATGGKGFFKHEMLLPIKQFKIVAFPDKSEYNNWQKKASELNKSGFRLEVNNWLENSNYDNGTDLADVYLNSLIELQSVD